MEILSYVLEGALEHQDSSGGGGVIRPGEIQLMRAGTGVTHSEQNHSKVDPVHFLQIWIVPDARGLKPAYGQQVFDRELASRAFVLLASKGGRDGSLDIHQDVNLWVAFIGDGRAAGAPAAPVASCVDPRRPRVGLGERDRAARGRWREPSVARIAWNSSGSSRPRFWCSTWHEHAWSSGALTPIRK